MPPRWPIISYMKAGDKRRQHKVRTYDLLYSLALASASHVRGDLRPCDPATAALRRGPFAPANGNEAAARAAGKRSAA